MTLTGDSNGDFSPTHRFDPSDRMPGVYSHDEPSEAFVLLVSLVRTLLFLRACYLVGFAVGYGIKEADRNSILFRCGAIGCGLVFVATGVSILLDMFRNRRA